MNTNSEYESMETVGQPDRGQTKKQWTVMIYLSGDNNLSEECVWAIKEMYRVGLKQDIAVVAQYKSIARGMPVTRYDVTAIPAPVTVAPYRAESYTAESSAAASSTGERQAVASAIRNISADGELNGFARADALVEKFVTATALINFAKDCIKQYPAEHYMLVLSGHGSGSVGKFFLKAENEGRFLSVPMLAFAIGEINKVLEEQKPGDMIDVIGLDACAMSTLEVGYQLRNRVKYMVGAEGFERNGGWPYHRILEILNEKPDIEPDKLVVKIVRDYVKYYFDYAVAGVSVDQSACDLSRMDDLAAAVNQLAKLLIGNQAVMDAVILAHWRAQSYLLEDYVDLWDFCDLLQAGCSDESVKQACQRVKALIDYGEQGKGPAVLKSCYSGAVYQHSHGLSIYFPWAEHSELYSHLSFAKRERPKEREDEQKPDDRSRSNAEGKGAKTEVKILDWFAYIQEYLVTSCRPVRHPETEAWAIGPADSSPGNVRLIPPIGRFLHTQDDRFLHTQDDKFGLALEAQVKNPPRVFHKDPCLDEPG